MTIRRLHSRAKALLAAVRIAAPSTGIHCVYLSGLAAIVRGFYLLFPPAGWIAAGGVLVLTALLLDRGEAKEFDESR